MLALLVVVFVCSHMLVIPSANTSAAAAAAAAAFPRYLEWNVVEESCLNVVCRAADSEWVLLL
jgi:hypothetical protein